LRTSKGIEITGHKLRFGINLTAGDVSSRMARVRVDGFSMLGAKVEVTVVSKLATLPLPEAVLAPIKEVQSVLPPLTGLIDPDDADPLVAGNTGNIVAGNTSNVLSNNGGSLAGTVQVAMLAAPPKFGLLEFSQGDFTGSASVAVLDVDGNVLVPAKVTGANGKFLLENLPTTPQLLVLEARTGEGNVLRTLVQAPGTADVTGIKVGPASTIATAFAVDALDTGEAPSLAIDLTGFAKDVSVLERELRVDEAIAAMTAAAADNANKLRTLWSSLGKTPSLVPGGAAEATTVAGTSRAAYVDGVVGGGGIDSSEPQFKSPTALAVGANGEIYVADEGANVIRKIVPGTGTVSTLAGDGTAGLLDGTGAGARFSKPSDLVRAADGYLYVLDSGNTTIRRVNPVNGQVTTLSTEGSNQPAAFQIPCSLSATLEGDLLVGDRGMHRIYLIKRPGTQEQTIEVLAGNGNASVQDGVGMTAMVKSPDGLAMHPGSGDVYFSDDHRLRVLKFGTNKLRAATPAATVATIAGSGSGSYEDGDLSVARFRQPAGMCFDAAGNLLIADRNNNCIRKFARSTNLVITAAGGRNSGFADGNGSTIRFTHPTDVVEGPDGSIYVADLDNYRIRKVTGY
jgi:sugar lactone lactonase YvrE